MSDEITKKSVEEIVEKPADETLSIKMPETSRKKVAKLPTAIPKRQSDPIIITQPIPEVVKPPYQPEKKARFDRLPPDYKDPGSLRHYLTETGKIRQRRGNSPKVQRRAAKAIKRARFLALIPYLIR